MRLRVLSLCCGPARKGLGPERVPLPHHLQGEATSRVRLEETLWSS